MNQVKIAMKMPYHVLQYLIAITCVIWGIGGWVMVNVLESQDSTMSFDDFGFFIGYFLILMLLNVVLVLQLIISRLISGFPMIKSRFVILALVMGNGPMWVMYCINLYKYGV